MNTTSTGRLKVVAATVIYAVKMPHASKNVPTAAPDEPINYDYHFKHMTTVGERRGIGNRLNLRRRCGFVAHDRPSEAWANDP